jgi:hypothetical protein
MHGADPMSQLVKPNPDDSQEDVIINGMGADDVSSIYPLETNEYYYQYSPRGNLLKN